MGGFISSQIAVELCRQLVILWKLVGNFLMPRAFYMRTSQVRALSPATIVVAFDLCFLPSIVLKAFGFSHLPRFRSASNLVEKDLPRLRRPPLLAPTGTGHLRNPQILKRALKHPSPQDRPYLNESR